MSKYTQVYIYTPYIHGPDVSIKPYYVPHLIKETCEINRPLTPAQSYACKNNKQKGLAENTQVLLMLNAETILEEQSLTPRCWPGHALLLLNVSLGWHRTPTSDVSLKPQQDETKQGHFIISSKLRQKQGHCTTHKNTAPKGPSMG